MLIRILKTVCMPNSKERINYNFLQTYLFAECFKTKQNPLPAGCYRFTASGTRASGNSLSLSLF